MINEYVMTKEEWIISLKETIIEFKKENWPVQFGQPFYDLCDKFKIDSEELKRELLNE